MQKENPHTVGLVAPKQKRHLSSQWSVYRCRSYLRDWSGSGKLSLTVIEPWRSSPELVSRLFSRRRKSLNRQFPYIVEALADLPAGTVVDGEVVAMDESGPPPTSICCKISRAEASRIQYYIFDLLCWEDRDLNPRFRWSSGVRC